MIDRKIRIEEAKNFSLVLPAVLIFAFFYILPFFYTFVLALFDGNASIPFERFVGLANFKEIIYGTESAKWWPSVGRSFYISFWALTFQNILAFALALAVDRAVRTGNIYRVIFFLLPILSEIIIGVLMRRFLLPRPGVFNHLLQQIGLGAWARDWLNDTNYALTTVAIIHCWRGFGWGFIILLAGLQTIPQQLYEAARIDGANAWQQFTRITVPLMVPVVCLVVILTILGTVQLIGLPMALTRGGPGGATTLAVMKILNDLNNYTGRASAQGIVLGIILVTISFTMLQVSKKLKKV